MGTTFLNLTNTLLVYLKQVKVSQSDFSSVRNIQELAKQAILDTVREINSHRFDWPFNAVEHTQTLTVGTEEYAWPSDFTAADWNSFQIQKDDSLGVNHRVLEYIGRDEWYEKYRDNDYDAESDGLRMPEFVFPAHGNGWGITPSPDQAYDIKYRYYKHPTDLSAYDDEVTIPSKFDYVIYSGALAKMNLFRENPDGYTIANENYQKGVNNMINLLLPNERHMYVNTVNNGGGAKRSYMWTGR